MKLAPSSMISQQPASSSSNPPEVMTVKKSALAFRYRPPTSQHPDSSRAKKPFELTLEFGPQRTGADMESEAIPIIEGDDSTGDEKFVSWNNEGKVYYETSIDAVRWDSANFMAPITGAVLSKVLDFAVEYTTQFPRYQPFEVYDVAQDATLVRSSGSDDFVWSLFGRLASLNVNLRPLLPQPQRKVRLYVNTSWETDMLQIMQQQTDNNEPPDDSAQGYGTTNAQEGSQGDTSIPEIPQPMTGKNSYKVIERIDAVYANKKAAEFFEELYRCGHSIRNQPLYYSSTPIITSPNETKQDGANTTEDLAYAQKSIPLASPTTSPQRNQSLSVEKHKKNGTQVVNSSRPPTSSPNKDRKDRESKNRGMGDFSHLLMSSTTSSLDVPPKNALLSGDGKLMMSTLTTCFESTSTGNVVYLYVDGVSYYRLNLTKPYWNTSILNEPLPAPSLYLQGHSDALDWSLAILILGGFFLGVYFILIQAGIVKTTPVSVRRCLNTFFRSDRPNLSTRGSYNTFRRKKYSDLPASEDNSIHSEDTDSMEGECGHTSNVYTTDEEDNSDGMDSNGIELRKSSTQVNVLQDQNSGTFIVEDLLSEKLEPLRTIGTVDDVGGIRLDNNAGSSLDSFGSNLALDTDMVHSRNLQVTDVVERANLKSTTKVAVPVSIAKRITQERQAAQRSSLPII